MHNLLPVNDRLRVERERLGLTQADFAALAGVTRKTLFSWESGKTAPDAFQLAALSTHGVDILYVVTGQRSKPEAGLPVEEAQLLDNYRRSSEYGKSAIQVVALLGTHSIEPRD